LSAFAERLFIDAFARHNTPEDMNVYLRSAFSPELQAREIADPAGLVLLALAPSLAAYAYIGRSAVPASVDDPDAIELKRFYLAQEWHGTGLATILMREVMRQASSRGARTMWLGVWEHNARGIAFYRKHGFREVGSHPFVLGSDVQRDLEMAVSLDPQFAEMRPVMHDGQS
jgi:diamine N-acetyltransferase